MGMGIGVFMVGVVLTQAGYSGALDVQPESAISTINFIMTFFGAILAFAMAIVFIPYKLSEKKMEEIVAELDAQGEIDHSFERTDG
jgi:Na+/melibiose symporter-like transporter